MSAVAAFDSVARYLAPTRLQQALAALAQPGGVTVLAGGTDLMPQSQAGKVRPARMLLNIRRIEGLDSVHVGDGQLVLGTLVSVTTLLTHPLVRQHAPHSPSPQPYLVPVRPITSRSIASALEPTSTVARCWTPLSVKAISTLSDIGQHPLGHVAQQFEPIPGAGAHVVDRPCVGGHGVGGLANRRRVEAPVLEPRLGAARADRRRRHRPERKPHVAQRAVVAAASSEGDRNG